MSLSKLPDRLKAVVNKGIRNSSKNLELEKPKVEELIFELRERTKYVESPEEYVHSRVSSPLWIEHEPFENEKKLGSFTVKTVDMISKFHSIDQLVISGLFLHEYSGFDALQTKFKKGLIVDCGFWTSKTSFIAFLKRFNKITFKTLHTNTSYINDEFFTEMNNNGTTMLFQFYRDRREINRLDTTVTDVTLNTLTRDRIPKELQLASLVTNFTFKRIKKLIEDALYCGMTEFDWDFGFLKMNQFLQVQRFVTEEFKEWKERMGRRLKIELNSEDHWYKGFREDYGTVYDRYKITDSANRCNEMCIFISVYKPIHVIYNQIEDSDDDDSDDYWESFEETHRIVSSMEFDSFGLEIQRNVEDEESDNDEEESDADGDEIHQDSEIDNNEEDSDENNEDEKNRRVFNNPKDPLGLFDDSEDEEGDNINFSSTSSDDAVVLELYIKTLTGKTITLRAKPMDTVRLLMEMIEETEGRTVDEQRLIFRGQQLERDRSLSSYAVENEDTLYLVFRLRG